MSSSSILQMYSFSKPLVLSRISLKLFPAISRRKATASTIAPQGRLRPPRSSIDMPSLMASATQLAETGGLVCPFAAPARNPSLPWARANLVRFKDPQRPYFESNDEKKPLVTGAFSSVYNVLHKMISGAATIECPTYLIEYKKIL